MSLKKPGAALQVEFISVEDQKDQIVSFAIAPAAMDSLTLVRSPQYEFLLPAEERGVSVSYSMGEELGLLLTVSWGSAIVLIESQLEAYKLDISKVDGEEIAHAKELLRKMMDDGRGDFINA